MRPIDADLLKTKINLKNAYDPTLIQLYEAIIEWIDCQPTVDLNNVEKEDKEE